MTIKELCKGAHKIATDKGFWEKCSICDGKKHFESFGVMTKCKFCTPNGKERRNVSELLMLCVSELGEACEALRSNYYADKKAYKQSKKEKEFKDESQAFKLYIKNSFEDEIADTFIRLGDLCEALNIDIEWHIKEKMKFNKTRPKKHNKEF